MTSIDERPAGGLDVLDQLAEVVFRTDAGGVWTYLNAAWARLTGFSVDDTLGTRFLDYVHPDEVEETLELFGAVVGGGADFCHHETRYRTADGGHRWVELRARVLRDEHGAIVGNAGTILDITQRRHSQELLARQAEVLERIAADAPLPEVLERLATFLADELEAPVRLFEFSEAPAGDAACDPGLAEERDRGVHDLEGLESPDGAPAAVSASPSAPPGRRGPLAASAADAGLALPVRSSAGTSLGGLVLHLPPGRRLRREERQVVERTLDLAAIGIERRHALESLRRRAVHDVLTGLPNRDLLADRFDQAVAASPGCERHVAVLLVDLDHFKEVNDMLGHSVGDQVLQAVGRRLRSGLRDADTVGRLGGDEFVAILPDLALPESAEEVAAKLRQLVRAPLEVSGLGLRVDASIGIAVCPGDGDTFEAMLKRADAAMYRVKPVGGLAGFSLAEDEARVTALARAKDLLQAIHEDALVLEYQPKLDLRTGTVVGLEALVRWPHPVWGLVPPEHFIPLAEGTGLIKELTWWVLDTALAEVHQRLGPTSPALAVNLSARLLHDPELPAHVESSIAGAGLAPGALELEVTESALMADPGRAIDAMAQLGRSGVHFALDDFGTGYSSLAYLRDLPARTIKIDKSFIQGLPGRARDVAIVRSAVELAHNLELLVVAEGVEDEGMLRAVDDLGFDQAQGFHLGPPVPAAGLVGTVAGRSN